MQQVLSDEQWTRIGPLLPVHRVSREGGRPRVADRACLEGILWVLRTGARWRATSRRWDNVPML